MSESPSQAPTPTPTPAPVCTPDSDASQYWCYHCDKYVSVETLANLPDVICHECKNGFVELIPENSTPPSVTPSFTSDQADDSTFGSQFLQMLRIITQSAREDDAPPPPPQYPPVDDFLRMEIDGWDNDEDGDEDEDDDDDANENQNENGNQENRDEGERDGEDGEDRYDNENEENRDEDDEEDLRRRRREILRLRIRDFATRTRSGRNRILDRADILMELEDNSIEFRLEVPESDRYIGNPADYVDAAGYEALLQNFAESGKRGAPPAAKSAVSSLPTVEITSQEETLVCAICKDMVNVGERETKLPCEHGYHGDCIVPWLDSRNSCPVCRFELPTDDPEYEEERKKRVAPSVGGASGSGGDSSGSS